MEKGWSGVTCGRRGKGWSGVTCGRRGKGWSGVTCGRRGKVEKQRKVTLRNRFVFEPETIDNNIL